MTAGGVAYELLIPLGVFETLPARRRAGAAAHASRRARGRACSSWASRTRSSDASSSELLDANGVGPALALGLLSALSAERVVRAIREKDIATLQGVPRVGRKTAERIILDLADKLDDLHRRRASTRAPPRPRARTPRTRCARSSSLGYHPRTPRRRCAPALDANGGHGVGAAN